MCEFHSTPPIQGGYLKCLPFFESTIVRLAMSSIHPSGYIVIEEDEIRFPEWLKIGQVSSQVTVQLLIDGTEVVEESLQDLAVNTDYILDNRQHRDGLFSITVQFAPRAHASVPKLTWTTIP